MNRLVVASLFLAAAGLAACSQQAMPSMSTSEGPSNVLMPDKATPVSVSGTVYDYASNAPIAGAKIRLAPTKANHFFKLKARTTSSGTFTFQAKPGSYVIEIIGAKTQAILHQALVVTSGKNVVTGIVPSPAPEVTYAPSQQSGHLRLMTLNQIQQACLGDINVHRKQLGLPAFEPDEYIEEDGIAVNKEQGLAKIFPMVIPLWKFNQPNGIVSQIAGYETQYQVGDLTTYELQGCQTQADDTYNKKIAREDIYAGAIDPKNIYFGADFEGTKAVSKTGWYAGFEGWNPDLRLTP